MYLQCNNNKKRDVEGESRGSSGGILYEEHQIMSSVEVSVAS